MDINNTKIVVKEMAFPEGRTFTKDELADVYNTNPNTYLVHFLNSNSENFEEPRVYRATSLKALKTLLTDEYIEGTETQIYKRVSIFKGNFTI